LVENGPLASVDRNAILFCGSRPIGICHPTLVVSAGSTSCEAWIGSSDVNNGSFHPNGGALQFVLSPRAGNYAIGTHVIDTTVADSQGDFDSYQSTILVVDDQEPWLHFQGHAYRLRRCSAEWEIAERRATSSSLCGAQAHLATISSLEENNFIFDRVLDRC
jgi:hypothetical protein